MSMWVASRMKCPRCRPMKTGRCEDCRYRARRNKIVSRVRLGELPLGRCYRCLRIHPMPPREGGERYCTLAPEYVTDWDGVVWTKLASVPVRHGRGPS